MQLCVGWGEGVALIKQQFFLFIFVYFTFLIVCVILYVCGHEHARQCMIVGARGQAAEVSPLFMPCGSRDQTRVVRAGSKCLYLPSRSVFLFLFFKVRLCSVALAGFELGTVFLSQSPVLRLQL